MQRHTRWLWCCGPVFSINRGYAPCVIHLQVVGQGKAILGYTIVGHVALLLLAEKTRISATLPGGHDVKTVTTTRWHRITLQVGPATACSYATKPVACPPMLPLAH